SALIDRTTNTILGINWGGIKIKSGKEKSPKNVATAAHFVQLALDGTFDQQISKRQAGRSLAQSAADKNDPSLTAAKADKKSKAACGILGISSKESSLLAMFLIPFLALLSRRQLLLITLSLGMVVIPFNFALANGKRAQSSEPSAVDLA